MSTFTIGRIQGGGVGTSTRIPYYNSDLTLIDDADLVFNDATTRFGVGVAPTVAKIEAAGEAGLIHLNNSGGNAFGYLRGSAAGNKVWNLGTTAVNDWSYGAAGASYFAIAAGEFGSANERLRITSAGVLISDSGGSNPTAQLHVAGSTATRASTRTQSGTAPTTPNDGDSWNDSTQQNNIDFINGIRYRRSAALFTSTATVTVANTITETTLIGGGVGTVTLPANFFVVGKTIRLRIFGQYGTAATAGTLQIQMKIGGTLILNSGAQTLANSLSAKPWIVDITITCRTTGASGTVFAQSTGGFMHSELAGTVGAYTSWDMTNAGTTIINTTIANAVDLTALFGTANASNTISSTNIELEVLN